MKEANDPEAFVCGVILAAGESSRMRALGRPKQLLPLAGRAVLEWVVEAALASRLDAVVLVLGAEAAAIRRELGWESDTPQERLRIRIAEGFERGQSASLRAGLASAPPETTAAAILLGDQPGVTPALIDTVIAAFLDSDLPVARPVVEGDPEASPGHPVLVARKLWSEAALIDGDQGLRASLSRRAADVLRVPIPISATGDGERAFSLPIGQPQWADLNTPEDWERIVDANRGLG